VRSSRKLERATYHNISFIWLMGGLKPDHKTIVEFRRKNKAVLKNLLKTCARLCIKLGLIAGNTLFVDSSKVRANASIKNTWTKEKCQRALEKIDSRIEAILSECDATDEYEQNQDSLVKMEKELRDKKVLKDKVKNILKKLKEENKKSINTTDSESTRISSIQGSHQGYSLQGAFDERNGLIVNYLCPEGHVLVCSYTNNYEGHKVYMMREKAICKQCPHFGVCTKSKQGRTIARLINEEVRQKLEAQYEESESQAIYKLRKEKAELPFGHIKRNLKVDAFLLRGRDGAKAEASLLASCFNIRRMISIIGIRALIKKLKDLASSRGTSLLDRRDITSPLAGLRNFAYSKEEIRENKENDVSALIENSNRREKTLINRVLKVLNSRFLCQRAFFQINCYTV